MSVRQSAFVRRDRSVVSGQTCRVEPLERRTLLSVSAGFTETTVASGLSYVADMDIASDGRLFVAGQLDGKIRVVKSGQMLSTPFATLPVSGSLVTGLLGVAVDPNFATNHYVYAYWTASSPGTHDRVSRFTAVGDVADPNSRVDLIDLPGPAQVHQGGHFGFGADGKLYLPVGDVGTPSNAQSLANPFGKVLRFNRDGTIPTDNPFYSQTTGINRAIWALGFRNPFQMSVQPATGKLFINDVGETKWEEIDVATAGGNFGWPGIEGPRTTQTAPANYRDPLYAYSHGLNNVNGCAITGGTFYAGSQFPGQFAGRHFFSDYCGGWIKSIDPANPSGSVQTFATGLNYPIAMKVGPDGSLYVLDHGTDAAAIGDIVQFTYTGATEQPPTILTQPAAQTVPVGQPATFTVQAAGTGTLGYQWQRNGADIAGANGASYTLPAALASDDGASFTVVVSNDAGSTTSNAAALSVVTNQYPNPVISTPAAGATYRAGDTISFAGLATDPEDGTLAASALTWSVVFHHDTHTHPFVGSLPGVSSGSFTIPTTGETSANTWYRIHLVARDSGGLTREVTRDIRPLTVNVKLAAATANGVPLTGINLTLDGQPAKSPTTVLGVAGFQRQLGAPASQTLNGTTYNFVGWSDGGAAVHTISTPSADKTYTAIYRPATLTATADAYVADSTQANKNFGFVTQSQVRSASLGGNRVTYLKFDLSQVGTINTAKLRLYGKLSAAAVAVPVGAYAISDTTWSEGTITLNHRPAKGALLTKNYVKSTTSAWVEWDLTAYLKAQKAAGKKVVSIAMVGLASSPVYALFNTREATSNRPALVLT